MVGVVSLRLSKTLMTPRFSATKTRPSPAKRTAVGSINPLNTVDCEKPGGCAAAPPVVLNAPTDPVVPSGPTQTYEE